MRYWKAMSEIRSVSQVSRLTSAESSHTRSRSETSSMVQVSRPIPVEGSRSGDRQARTRRRTVVLTLRVLLLVVILGGWELGTRVGFIDPFFWGQPSGVW